jgi:hypothetical protein
MSEPDELYTLRNLFWLGNYQVKQHASLDKNTSFMKSHLTLLINTI